MRKEASVCDFDYRPLSTLNLIEVPMPNRQISLRDNNHVDANSVLQERCKLRLQ